MTALEKYLTETLGKEWELEMCDRNYCPIESQKRIEKKMIQERIIELKENLKKFKQRMKIETNYWALKSYLKYIRETEQELGGYSKI